VIAALLQAVMESHDYPHAAVPYAEVGDRFGVSRTHVRKLLVAAEERGLVKLHARGGRRLEILPRLWSSHDRGITGGMYLHDILYVAAIRRMAATKPQRAATS
jgi:DNA-binding FadR family transcriptional regulator